MEKYSKWKDPATGIHPFLPPKPKNLPTSASDKAINVLSLVLAPFLFVLRVPLVLIVSLWLLVFSTLFGAIPVPLVQRFFLRYIHLTGCRILLFLFGFLNIRTSVLHPRQRSKHIEVSPGSGIGAGDVIVCNYTSYVQHLYFAFRFSAAFLLPIDDGSGKVCELGLGQMILHTLFATALDKSRAKPLQVVVQQANHPFVLYPEGTSSNGVEILRFQPVLPSSPSSKNALRVHIAAVRFDSPFSPTFTVGYHPLLHVLRLLVQPASSMQVCYCAPEAVPSLSPTSSSTPVTTSVLGQPATATSSGGFTEDCTKVMASLFQMHCAPLGLKEKAEFVEYYGKIEKGGYADKKRA